MRDIITTTPIYIPTHVDVYPSLTTEDDETFITVETNLGEEAELLAVIYPDKFLNFTVDYETYPLPKSSMSVSVIMAPILFDYLTQKYFGKLMLYVENMSLLSGDFPFMFSITSYNITRMTPMGYYKGSITIEPWNGFFLEKDDEMMTEYFSFHHVHEEGSQLKAIILPSFQTMTIHPI